MRWKTTLREIWKEWEESGEHQQRLELETGDRESRERKEKAK